MRSNVTYIQRVKMALVFFWLLVLSVHTQMYKIFKTWHVFVSKWTSNREYIGCDCSIRPYHSCVPSNQNRCLYHHATTASLPLNVYSVYVRTLKSETVHNVCVCVCVGLLIDDPTSLAHHFVCISNEISMAQLYSLIQLQWHHTTMTMTICTKETFKWKGLKSTLYRFGCAKQQIGSTLLLYFVASRFDLQSDNDRTKESFFWPFLFLWNESYT